MIAELCTYHKKYWIVHLKWINFMVRQLYLNKAINIFKKNKKVKKQTMFIFLY